MRRLLWGLLALLALPCALPTTVPAPTEEPEPIYTPIEVPASAACCPGHNVLLNGRCMDEELQTLTEEDRLAVERPGAMPAEPIKRKRVQIICEEGMYLIEPWKEFLGDELHIDEEDRLAIGNDDGVIGEKGKFCIADKIDVNKSLDIRTIDILSMKRNQVALVCFVTPEETFLTATVSGTLALVSVGFLVLTLLVYTIVPELRDLQGKCMMCTALCLCFGFFHLSMAQLLLIRGTVCIVNGFLIFFWMLGAFVWMNVVSINVMRAAVFRPSKMSDKKTFWAYSAYGWGFPLIFMIAGIIAEHTEGDHHKPGFGKNSCWFSGTAETWVYFYGPMATLLVCNIFLFFVTSIHLWKQTNYENVTKMKSLRYKFLLYLKIFLVMGLSWIFEIISFVHDTRHIVWLMIDTFNCLQGLVFFLVLVLLRKRAMRGLAARGLRVPCCRLAHTGPDEECEEIVTREEEAPALTTFS